MDCEKVKLFVVVAACIARTAASSTSEECVDVPDWTDGGWTCVEYSKLVECGGDGSEVWDAGAWGSIEMWPDLLGRTAFDACCACLGKEPEVVPTKSPTPTPTRFPTLDGEPTWRPTPFPTRSPTVTSAWGRLVTAVADAPTDGTATEILVHTAFLICPEPITIKAGQNIVVKGQHVDSIGEWPEISAKGEKRIFIVEAGAEFAIERLRIGFGYSHSVENGGGAILSFGVIRYIRQCSFHGNKALDHGGAISLEGEFSRIDEITNCRFRDNSAGISGGAINIYKSTFSRGLVISNSTFYDNEAYDVWDHRAQSSGGAITINKAKGNVTILGSFFVRNNAGQGGAIRLQNCGPIIFLRNHFRNNFAFYNGGAVYSYKAIANFTQCSFTRNECKNQWATVTFGGAIANSGIMDINECTFLNSTALHYGQDLYADAIGSTTVRDSTFLSPESSSDDQRVVGALLTCASGVAICPHPRTTCVDSTYGVTCHFPCKLGHFGLSPHSCHTCSKGKYGEMTHVLASKACQLCPTGRANPNEGQPGIESCKMCAPGMHATMGSPKCFKVCSRGEQQIAVDTCADCPAGKTSSDDSIQICVDCSPGEVAPLPGLPYCDPCDEGTFAANSTYCATCPAGYYCPRGASQPIRCDHAESFCPQGTPMRVPARAGFYTDDSRTQEIECEPGFYCINGIKRPCPSRTYGDEEGLKSDRCSGACSWSINRNSSEASTACSCLFGFINMGTGNELDCKCPPGFYRSIDSAAPSCVACKVGTVHRKATMNSPCRACGSFQTSNNNRTTCVPSAAKLIPLILLIAISLLAAAYVIRRGFKKTRARVNSLRHRVSIVGLELQKERKRVKELVKLSKPTDAQNELFSRYREILRGSDRERMPFPVKLYSMESIRLEKSLGKGAYGEVFKGRVADDHFGEAIEKEVALKQLHIKSEYETEKTLNLFVDEVRNLIAVGSHENIVPFFGVAWDEGSFPSIVLEFIAGGELTSFLEDFEYAEGDLTGLDNPTLNSIALGIIRGVHHIHLKEMIHRDLKPQNVLLDVDDASRPPVPKIADFGMSRKEDMALTMTSVGTPYYAAPEVIRCERYNHFVDVFSLGIVLNQIDTLQDPSTGVNWGAMNARKPGSFRPLPREGVRKEISNVIQACMRFEKPSGDLSYGRPSTSKLLELVAALRERRTLSESGYVSIKKKIALPEEETRDEDAAITLKDAAAFFIRYSEDEIYSDDNLKELPMSSLERLLRLAIPFAKKVDLKEE